MQNRLKIFQVDAFTDKPFMGNPAGVVPDADGLSDFRMQQIARELNNPETAFIFRPDSSDHDFMIRFFTPTTEVPICGHATIAANYILAAKYDRDGILRQKSKAGTLKIEVVENHDHFWVYMTQNRPEFLHKIQGIEYERLLGALSLNETDLVPHLPVQIVSTGHSKVIIPLVSRATLNSILPSYDTLADISKEIGCNGFFVYTQDSSDPGFHAHCRMFAPAIGIPEDPVTGNGNGPLGAYLVHYQAIPVAGDVVALRTVQGETMKRRGETEVLVRHVNKKPIEVTVGGSARIVFEATLFLS